MPDRCLKHLGMAQLIGDVIRLNQDPTNYIDVVAVAGQLGERDIVIVSGVAPGVFFKVHDIG